MIKTFSKLKRLNSFKDRYEYLKLDGIVGEDTFGRDRRLNQVLYKSSEWLDIRNHVIVRDKGLDLGCRGYEIFDHVIIHHMNPISISDLLNFNPDILDPEFLITTSPATHQAIHYGDKKLLPRLAQVRKPGDTRLW